MTNTKMLKDIIDKSGLKLGFIAEHVGISRQSLWNKVHNRTTFNQYEIGKLCKILKITSLKMKEQIFFGEE